MSLSWRPLLLGDFDPRIPPLLLAQKFQHESYEIYLTDMTHLWTETLNRRMICTRAGTLETPIDPTEDAEQMKLLLQKIQDGLNLGKDAEVSMTLGSGTSHGDYKFSELNIKLVIELPKPFKPLEWTCTLSQARNNKIVEHFIFPLVCAQNDSTRDLESLIEMMADKDHVIQKLADKLEASGTDLGQVFPSASGKGGRKLTRKTIEKRVKGLSAFDRQVWQQELDSTREKHGVDDDVGDVWKAVKGLVSEALVLPVGGNIRFPGPVEGAGWWNCFGEEVIPISTREKVDETNQAPADEQDNGVEVPGTPPPAAGQKPSRGRSRHTRQIVDDDSTGDEDDLDAGSQRVPDSFRASQQSAKVPAKKIGVIGTKKQPPKAKPPACSPGKPRPSQSQSNHTMVQDDDDTTADQDDKPPEPRKSSPQKSSPRKGTAMPDPVPTPAKSPKKEGLGKIGGASKKAVTLPPASELEPENSSPQASQMTPRTKPKLGRLGHRRDDDEDERWRTAEKGEEKRRETSEEPRERRKRELEEELERKRNMPKKKKRKF